jgi:hypothetical protein
MDRTVHGFNVRQTKIHTAEPLVPESGAYELEMTITNIIRHQSPGTDKISAELVKERGRTIAVRSITLLIRFVIRRNCQWSGKSQTVYKKGDKTDCSYYTDILFLSSTTKCFPTSCCQGKLLI